MRELIDGYTTLGNGLTRPALLRQMDGTGVARAVIAPEERELAVYNAEGNERILAEAARAQARFIPACCASPWRGAEAEALVCAAAERGARMLVFSPAVQGFMMTDESVAPLLDIAGRRGLPVYVHTGPHSMGAPAQTVLAAQRYPETRFILGHCGTTDYAWDLGSIARFHLADNLFLESSFSRPWALPDLVRVAGFGRVIFGSGAPRNDLALELSCAQSVLARDQYPQFYGRTLARLLGENEAC